MDLCFQSAASLSEFGMDRNNPVPAVLSAMYEDENYTRDKQKQFDVIVRSLKSSLKDAGIEDVLDIQRGSMRVVKEKFGKLMSKLLGNRSKTAVKGA